jgi:hypothetical protein
VGWHEGRAGGAHSRWANGHVGTKRGSDGASAFEVTVGASVPAPAVAGSDLERFPSHAAAEAALRALRALRGAAARASASGSDAPGARKLRAASARPPRDAKRTAWAAASVGRATAAEPKLPPGAAGPPLTRTNRGFQLLEVGRLGGWAPGQRLGLHGTGLLEPLGAGTAGQRDRRGVGFGGLGLGDLSADQLRAVEAALCGGSLFLTGNAGSGKSTALRVLIEELRADGKKVAVTAMTGAAAVLVEGRTLHSWAGVGLGTDETYVLKAKLRGWEAKLRSWAETDVLVVDEVSMLDSALFEKLEEIARFLRESDLPFGGMQLICTGDFAQLPPVRKHARRGSSGSAQQALDQHLLLFQCDVFKRTVPTTILLTQPHRQRGDSAFSTLLDELRLGIVSLKTEQLLNATNYQIVRDDNIIPTRLYAKNEKVDEENDKELQILSGQLHSFDAIDGTPQQWHAKSQTSEAEPLLLRDCSWPRVLHVKVGAQVMLLKNLDVRNGLANGSRGVVVSISDEQQPCGRPEQVISVLFKNGNVEEIGTHTFEIQDEDERILASRTQFPLRLAWCITIHKSQVGIGFKKPAFFCDNLNSRHLLRRLCHRAKLWTPWRSTWTAASKTAKRTPRSAAPNR